MRYRTHKKEFLNGVSNGQEATGTADYGEAHSICRHDLDSDILPASDNSVHAQCVVYMSRKYRQDMCQGIGKTVIRLSVRQPQ